jgi:hypothetical protein
LGLAARALPALQATQVGIHLLMVKSTAMEVAAVFFQAQLHLAAAEAVF